jgi:hypothetical protein
MEAFIPRVPLCWLKECLTLERVLPDFRNLQRMSNFQQMATQLFRLPILSLFMPFFSSEQIWYEFDRAVGSPRFEGHVLKEYPSRVSFQADVGIL